MRFDARKAAKSALWIFCVVLFVVIVGDLVFNQFHPRTLDWREWIAKAILLTAIFSVLGGRGVRR